MSNFGSILQDFLSHKYSDCEFVCGESYESIIWMDGNPLPQPSLQEVIDGIEDYKKNYNTYEYRSLRSMEYDRFADQLDALWHSMDSNEIPKSAAFYSRIKAVKDKYPKSI